MQWAQKCYNSIKKSTIKCDIITIDNGSTDGTQKYIRKNYPEVELIETGKNLGFGHANNIGLQKALDEGYEYVYLLNQDAWIMPDTFEKLISVSRQHKEYGVLSPIQLKADEQHMDTRFVINVIGRHQCISPYFIEDLYFGREENVYEVSFVMAAHWLITRECLEIVGGFSPTFPHYGEDDNYLYRLAFWGMKVGIVPSAKAIHDRANEFWSDEKMCYIEDYVAVLGKCSHPVWKYSLKSCIKESLKKAYKTRNKNTFKYAIQLFKERKKIKKNLEESLKEKAFLS